jgi:hypothetical protein
VIGCDARSFLRLTARSASVRQAFACSALWNVFRIFLPSRFE